VVFGYDINKCRTTHLASPNAFTVDTPNKNLQHELQWYLETYLQFPVSTFRDRADKVQSVLTQWGQDAFNVLFHNDLECWESKLENIRIEIISNHPAILAWPWEALKSNKYGFLALKCSIERQLSKVNNINITATMLPKDQLNILYILARPSNESSVSSLAKPLIDFTYAKGEHWSVRIDLLRPPTYDQLCDVLKKNSNFYHIIHFDGHGAYVTPSGVGSNSSSAKSIGILKFEDIKGKTDNVTANALSSLL